ncbi:MAG: hypothetical protein GX352_07195 [Clostridiales bacterium]|nr:hypothetical protein [Clostridiales bacterium]
MKKKAVVLFIMLSIIFITACQQTPDEPIVRGKDIDNIIKKGIEDPTEADIESGEDLRKPIEAPEKFRLEIEGKHNNLKVHVDADVVVPNASSMPIAKADKRIFTEEDVEKLFKVFGKDAKTIDPDSLYTSDYYLNMVKELRGQKDLPKQKMAGDQKVLEEELGVLGFGSVDEYIDEQINELLEKAAEAPDEYVMVEPDFTFKAMDDPHRAGFGDHANILFTSDKKIVSRIEVVPDSFGTGGYATYLRDNTRYNEINTLETAYSEEIGDYYNPEEWTLPAMNQDDAQRLAEDTISQLGLDEFVCTAKRITPMDRPNEVYDPDTGRLEGLQFSNNRIGIYEFMFTRKINDVPITYTNNQGLTTVHEAYFAPWMYEKIHIFIDDEGVFYFKWNSPYEIKEIVSDASKLLPFSDIQDVFKSMMPIRYDYWDSDERYSYEVEVTEVKLGLMRVTEKDVGDSGLLIPVWDFFGVLDTKGKPGQPNVSEGIEYYTHVSFLTINAIDGTIIDRSLGY